MLMRATLGHSCGHCYVSFLSVNMPHLIHFPVEGHTAYSPYCKQYCYEHSPMGLTV